MAEKGGYKRNVEVMVVDEIEIVAQTVNYFGQCSLKRDHELTRLETDLGQQQEWWGIVK